MITLASDCLIFQMAGGEGVPFSSDMICVEVVGDTAKTVDPDHLRQAAKAVFHYFRHEVGRQTVTVGEFTEVLEKVLHGLNLYALEPEQMADSPEVVESDLRRLARESGPVGELLFFPRLRDELRHHLHLRPRLLRYHGLRGCVKQLAGAQRWNGRCRSLEDQIIAYLRECLTAEQKPDELAFVVE